MMVTSLLVICWGELLLRLSCYSDERGRGRIVLQQEGERRPAGRGRRWMVGVERRWMVGVGRKCR